MKIWYIVTFVIILLIVVGIIVYFSKKKGNGYNPTDTGSNIMLKFPAKRGDRGDHVKVIQRWANQSLNPPMVQLDEDGIWGSLTDTAMIFLTGKSTVTYPEYKNMT